MTLITPADMKIFKLTPSPAISADPSPAEKAPALPPSVKLVEPGQEAAVPPPPSSPRPSPRPALVQDSSAPPSPELADYEREMAEAAVAAADLARMNGEVVEFPPAEAAPEAAPPARRKRNERPTADRPNSPCGRCEGAGSIIGGGTCPVCRGTGSIAKWGRGGR